MNIGVEEVRTTPTPAYVIMDSQEDMDGQYKVKMHILDRTNILLTIILCEHIHNLT